MNSEIAKHAKDLEDGLNAIERVWPSLRENVAINGVFLSAGNLITALAQES